MKYLVFVFFIVSVTVTFGQDRTNLDLFQYEKYNSNPKQNYFDWSVKYKENIEVKLWGVVRNPGVYKVAEGTNVIELLTFAGGLTENAEIEDIRIIRDDSTSTDVYKKDIITISYEELYDNDISKTEVLLPELKQGDVLIVKKLPQTIWQEIRNIYPLVTAITSLISLIVLLSRN